MNNINWKFIGSREGSKLNGYVPAGAPGHSGVTIATGFDIGNASDADMALFPLALRTKLAPYRHLVGIPALHMLQTNRLTVTVEEAAIIDKDLQGNVAEMLENKYELDANVAFGTLPEPAQTVIASVTFQYGRPWDKTPLFWNAVVKQDWQAAHQILMNFGDKYSARRKIEAAYLAPIINVEGATTS